MKILICDTLNSKVLEELQSLGECIDISASKSKDKDLVSEIIDAEVVVIRSSTQLTKEIIEKGDKLKIIARCGVCLLYTSPSPRDYPGSRMPSSA